MQSFGAESNGYQSFRYDEEPFKALLSDLRFTVQGGDFRTPAQVIEIVDLPAVIATEVDCQFPAYLVDEESGSWTARTLTWPSGVELPIGTSAVLRCQTSKPLDRVYARHVEIGSFLCHRFSDQPG